MNGYLLDTSVALIAVTTPDRISARIRAAITQGPSFLSLISYWEVIIKSGKGTLDVGDPRQWWRETLDALALTPLLLQPEHIAAIHDLPPIHQDPFDRALIAQAIAGELTLLTTDATVAEYAPTGLRVVR